MELSEAKALLERCVRDELRDHAFGDAEVSWRNEEGEIASGYFSRNKADVWIPTNASFDGDEARELRKCGSEGHIERNDETGPTEYAEGQIMPGLTKEGVLQELLGDVETHCVTRKP